MKNYKYESYEEYVAAQTDANKRKLKRHHKGFVDVKTIQLIGRLKKAANKVLCHGTRGGQEQKYFVSVFPNATIVGTEISDTADNFPMTTQHDFHEVREEWVGQFDIVYSNSWDHSYDPTKSLKTWSSQLNESGRLYLDFAYSPTNNKSSKVDPLEISNEEVEQLLKDLGMNIISTHETFGGADNRKPCRLYEIEND